MPTGTGSYAKAEPQRTAAADPHEMMRRALLEAERTPTEPFVGQATVNDAEFVAPSRHKGVLGLGHFDVLETLGRGGYGVVVKAFDRKLQRVVAVKMMLEELATTSPARKRFVREARAAAAVRHENIVQIYNVEELPLPHLVMEFIPGGSLQHFIDNNGPLDVETVQKIGVQVARGLAAAHAIGLVHRDIKPANILLETGTDLRVKLTDFGLARAADDASLTQSGYVVGTPMYMAPEQASGTAFDHRSDLFSLGSVLYVMVTGRPPFRADNSLAVLKRVSEAAPRPVREIMPETPEWLCAIIDRLHMHDPELRFQSAEEVAEAFSTRKTDPVAVPRVPTPLPTRKRLRVNRRDWAYVAALLVAVCALALTWRANANVEPDIERAETTEPPPIAEPSTRFTNKFGMSFALVPAGMSWMGGSGGMLGTRAVEVVDDFYLGVHEVTHEQWDAVMGPGKDPSRFSRTGELSESVADVSDVELKRYPVDGVSWDDCQVFLRRLNAQAPKSGWVYRMPTSTEWEFALRGGGQQSNEALRHDYYHAQPSNTLPPDQVNCFEAGLQRSRPVGLREPNSLGLYDMHGNVFEWCHDRYEEKGELFCPIRGGFWADSASSCRARSAPSGLPHARYIGAGLRVACLRVTSPETR